MRYFKNTGLILVIIIILGAYFRFYKLDWGNGLFTHPDEYHIAAAASQLSFPDQMNPHFFSYGTVTIYLIYFTKLLFESIIPPILNLKSLILNPFLIGRFYSALFSTLTILLVHQISKMVLNTRYALLAAALTALTAGLIQQAHFATPESNLTFFLLGSLLFLLKFNQNHKSSQIFWASLFFGLALGVKVSSLFFAPTLLIAIALVSKLNLFSWVKYSLITLTISALTFAITSPFTILDYQNFRSTFNYESSLATGELPVFYTRQFIETVPILFQLQKVLPFALGPTLLILGIIGLILMAVLIFKDRKLFTFYLLLITSFLSLFLSNAFLFAKWTRFLAPTFPFFAIFTAFFLYQLSQFKLGRSFPIILNSTFLILNFLWALAFFNIYLRPDVRLTAATWVNSTLPIPATVFLEEGNMIDLPLKANFTRLSANFYDLEASPQVTQKVVDSLEKADYFIIQSRRIFLNHMRLPEQFPKTAKLYNNLFSDNLGFTEIAEFNSFPSISILGEKMNKFFPLEIEFPDETAEETWTVFDHPVIRVFKKTGQLSREEYLNLL